MEGIVKSLCYLNNIKSDTAFLSSSFPSPSYLAEKDRTEVSASYAFKASHAI